MPLLNSEEAKLVLDSWKLIEKDVRGHGLKFFSLIFTNHPDIQAKYFPMLGGNDVDRLGGHGSKVMQDVGNMALFASQHDDQKLSEKIAEITQYHEQRKIGVCQFKIINKCLLEYLSLALGSNLSPEGVSAWKKLLDAMLVHMQREHSRIQSLK